MRELLSVAEGRHQARLRAEELRRAQAGERKRREPTLARAKYLDSIEGQEAALWQRIDALAGARRAAEYDQAVQLLVDLRDLSARGNQTAAFATRLSELRERRPRKPSFLERLDRVGLG